MSSVSSINSESMDPNALREVIQGNSTRSSSDKIDQAGEQFEAIFIRQFLNDALKPMVKGEEGSEDDATSSTYRYMITDQLSQSLASQGIFGLGSKISEQLKARHPEKTQAAPSGRAVGLDEGRLIKLSPLQPGSGTISANTLNNPKTNPL